MISAGVFSPVYKPDYPLASLMIPGIVLGAVSLATTARLTRTSIMENIRADYVRTAKAKGLPQAGHRRAHAPQLADPGDHLPRCRHRHLMAGAVVTETIFNVPGIGRLVTLAPRGRRGLRWWSGW